MPYNENNTWDITELWEEIENERRRKRNKERDEPKGVAR